MILVDGDGLRVEPDPVCGIAAKEKELLHLLLPAGLEDVKGALHTHVKEGIRVLLRRRELHDEVGTAHRFLDRFRIGDAPLDRGDPRALHRGAVDERPHRPAPFREQCEDTTSEFASGPEDGDSLAHDFHNKREPLAKAWQVAPTFGIFWP